MKVCLILDPKKILINQIKMITFPFLKLIMFRKCQNSQLKGKGKVLDHLMIFNKSPKDKIKKEKKMKKVQIFSNKDKNLK